MAVTVRDIMTTGLTTVAPDMSAVDAAKAMKDEDAGVAPVTEGQRLVGMLTDRDLVVRVLAEQRDPTAVSVREVMSGELVTISADADAREAAALMRDHRVRRIPVADGARLVGIVSQADIARTLPNELVGDVVTGISQ
jgi:CBS domain-containing protein